MAVDLLRQQLNELYAQLEKQPLQAADYAQLKTLTCALEQQIQLEQLAETNPSLADSVDLAAERFEISHPVLASTLRAILNSLTSMGV